MIERVAVLQGVSAVVKMGVHRTEQESLLCSLCIVKENNGEPSVFLSLTEIYLLTKKKRTFLICFESQKNA